MQIQGTSGQNADAIDYLLNGRYYMSASGPVFNEKYDKSNSSTATNDNAAIRCVRDAY